MSFTPPPSAAPTPPEAPSRDDTDEGFDEKANALVAWYAPFVVWLTAFVSWIATFLSEISTAIDHIDDSTAAATAAAAAASGFSTASKWVSGTVYVDGAVVWSPTNYLSYRRKGAGGGTTDPAADTNHTDWEPSNIRIPFTPTVVPTQLAEIGGRYSLEKTTAEGAGTNLLLHSDDFTNAVWVTQGLNVASNVVNSPDGDLLADRLTNTAGTISLVSQTVTVSPSSVNDYYASIFVKKGSSSIITLNVFYNAGTEVNAIFNLDSGVVSGIPYAGEYIMQPYGDGFWRIGYRIARDASGLKNSIAFRIWESSRGTGVAGNNLHVWRAQLEAGAVATSSIKSVATAGTRIAGVIPAQRVVLPATPPNNALVSIQIGNGIENNVVHPNGSTLEGTTGPALLDFPTGVFEFQYINNTWRAV